MGRGGGATRHKYAFRFINGLFKSLNNIVVKTGLRVKYRPAQWKCGEVSKTKFDAVVPALSTNFQYEQGNR